MDKQIGARHLADSAQWLAWQQEHPAKQDAPKRAGQRLCQNCAKPVLPRKNGRGWERWCSPQCRLEDRAGPRKQ